MFGAAGSSGAPGRGGWQSAEIHQLHIKTILRRFSCLSSNWWVDCHPESIAGSRLQTVTLNKVKGLAPKIQGKILRSFFPQDDNLLIVTLNAVKGLALKVQS